MVDITVMAEFQRFSFEYALGFGVDFIIQKAIIFTLCRMLSAVSVKDNIENICVSDIEEKHEQLSVTAASDSSKLEWRAGSAKTGCRCHIN